MYIVTWWRSSEHAQLTPHNAWITNIATGTMAMTIGIQLYIYILILIVKVVPYVRSPMNVRMRRFSVRGVICTNLHHAIIIPATSKSKDALSAWMAVNEL